MATEVGARICREYDAVDPIEGISLACLILHFPHNFAISLANDPVMVDGGGAGTSALYEDMQATVWGVAAVEILCTHGLRCTSGKERNQSHCEKERSCFH
jgi:hypothetical protein